MPVLLSGIAVAFFFGPVAFGTFTELPPKVFSHGYQVQNIVRQLDFIEHRAIDHGIAVFLRQVLSPRVWRSFFNLND